MSRLTGCTVLEAPHLRDDYYCSVLAYSHTADRLAVALGEKVFLWSEGKGVMPTPDQLQPSPGTRLSYVTSLSFSSVVSGNAVLAVARVNGVVMLYSPLDEVQRFIKIDVDRSAVNCSFRPLPVRRSSLNLDYVGSDQEVLAIGDELGLVNIYFIDWPKTRERDLFNWHGGFQRHAQLDVHDQQICGIAWSNDGEFLATGGNDNLCCLFDFKRLLNSPETVLRAIDAKHIWRLNAAVKAIAFCPWQRGLLAAGGGSNDRAIHFFHTISGASLAMIECAAQVTSLIWSTRRREIVATFGFASQPEHPYRIVVYAWPSCQQVVAIPWVDDIRALYAISYPSGPSDAAQSHQQQAAAAPNQDAATRRRLRRFSQPSFGAAPNAGTLRPDLQESYPSRQAPPAHRTIDGLPWTRRTGEEGCIVVASSEGTIKFHEVWADNKKSKSDRGSSAVGGRAGLLGGSSILESLHGIEKECGVIR
ncbi:MAG: hypothetical protein Q9159_006588 [Coniocarpon cinnabarinum]